MPRQITPVAKEFIKANQGKHACRCGCGKQILIKAEHLIYGIPDLYSGHRIRRRMPVKTRLLSRVNTSNPDACWLWPKPRKDGCGQMQVGADHNKKQLVHRISWEVHYGPIPDGLVVCHKCDVSRCINPRHLFLGTYKDNAADMVDKGRHRHGERAVGAKLTTAQVVAIKRRLAAGDSKASIAAEYGVTAVAIYHIATGKNWRHVQA